MGQAGSESTCGEQACCGVVWFGGILGFIYASCSMGRTTISDTHISGVRSLKLRKEDVALALRSKVSKRRRCSGVRVLPIHATLALEFYPYKIFVLPIQKGRSRFRFWFGIWKKCGRPFWQMALIPEPKFGIWKKSAGDLSGKWR